MSGIAMAENVYESTECTSDEVVYVDNYSHDLNVEVSVEVKSYSLTTVTDFALPSYFSIAESVAPVFYGTTNSVTAESLAPEVYRKARDGLIRYRHTSCYC